jgi:putative endonuclease
MPGWQDKDPCVYILTNKRDGVLYTGVTTQLFERVSLHKQNLFDGFTKKYNVHRLVYYEFHEHMDAALLREARIKKWQRAWKVRLIHSGNPEWTDLFDGANGCILTMPGDISRLRG